MRSSQEEADTLLIMYAVAVSHFGKTPHIYTCDTDVLVLALRRSPDLNKDSLIIMGTGDRRRKIQLQPIYVALGPERAAHYQGSMHSQVAIPQAISVGKERFLVSSHSWRQMMMSLMHFVGLV